MNFKQKLCDLIDLDTIVYSANDPNAILYGKCENLPDRPKHIVYRPMTDSLLDHLIQSYKGEIPEELMEIYRAMNGADLFWTTRYIEKLNIRIPFCTFSIYGIPLSDSRESLQPFNISVEDLNRPINTPESWLKFGSFYMPKTTTHRRDLYVDTNEKKVYAVDHDEKNCIVVSSWQSIDSCLCDILSLLMDGID